MFVNCFQTVSVRWLCVSFWARVER